MTDTELLDGLVTLMQEHAYSLQYFANEGGTPHWILFHYKRLGNNSVAYDRALTGDSPRNIIETEIKKVSE